MTSCQRTACRSWSWWEGSCLLHPFYRVCCRHSSEELQTGSQCTLYLLYLGLLIFPVTEFAACVDAQGKFFSLCDDIDTSFCPSYCPQFFAFLIWVKWALRLSLDMFCLTVFGEDELGFGILPLLVRCILVPIVCARQLGIQPMVNFRVNCTTTEIAAGELPTLMCLTGTGILWYFIFLLFFFSSCFSGISCCIIFLLETSA